MVKSSQNPYLAALQWHIDVGADEVLQDEPRNFTLATDRSTSKNPTTNASVISPHRQTLPLQTGGSKGEPVPPSSDLQGTIQARAEAEKLAKSANTLEELREAIANFDGLSLKKTATKIVFADGNPKARIMLIGDAPASDEDKQGIPFVGEIGHLQDKILKSIGLARDEENIERAVYLSNILNWRPPGNRTPSQSEIDISLPFIERHIALIAPKLLIFCGGVTAKALLGSGESISRLRGKFHDYRPLTSGISNQAAPITAMATYHPSNLLKTPSQKKLVWEDMLMLKAQLEASE